MENCDECQKDQKKAAAVGVALGIALGVGITFAVVKYGKR